MCFLSLFFFTMEKLGKYPVESSVFIINPSGYNQSVRRRWTLNAPFRCTEKILITYTANWKKKKKKIRFCNSAMSMRYWLCCSESKTVVIRMDILWWMFRNVFDRISPGSGKIFNVWCVHARARQIEFRLNFLKSDMVSSQISVWVKLRHLFRLFVQ